MKKVIALIGALAATSIPAFAGVSEGQVVTDYGTGSCIGGVVKFNPDSPPVIFDLNIYVRASDGQRYTAKYSGLTHYSATISLNEHSMGLSPDRILYEILPKGKTSIHEHVQCI